MDEKDFCDSTAVWNSGVFGDETSWVCEPDDVVESRATIEDFKSGAAKGKDVETYDTPHGTLYVWENVKPRPASSKGNLFAMENGEKTLSFFAGVA
tara:strand:+ start:1195 stop:1482 length:288 start_codon:yes stop_codon:yes gene_type:complete